MLRGAAAGAVVLSHLTYLIWRQPDIIGGLIAYPPVPKIIKSAEFLPLPDFGLPYFWGYIGVALFFLISGFVIPFSVSTLSRTGFAIARLFRIWPTYLVGLSVALACIASNSKLAHNTFPFSPLEVLTNALIVPRWPTLTRSIDGITWTLEIEIFFYAGCALLMQYIRKLDRRIFLLPALIVPLTILFGSRGGGLIRFGMPIYALAYWVSTVPVYLCFMLCGVAFYYHYHGRLSYAGLFFLHAFLLAAFVTSMRIGALAMPDWTGPICYLVAYGVFTVGYLTRDRTSSLPISGRRPIFWLADISYPLYVIHGVLGYTLLVHALEIGMPGWAAVVATLAAVLTLAALLHRLIEMPSQSYGKILAAKMPPASYSGIQSDAAAISRLKVATTSETAPNSIIRPSRR